MAKATHVLVVEDEAALADLLKYNLEKEGYRVSVANDGEEALVVADESAPDLVDVDVFKFKLPTPTKVMVRVTYKVSYGDLDVALFRMAKDDSGVDRPQRVVADLTAVDNGCLEAPNLPAPGPYYVVVRGTNSPEKPATYTMNNYNIRVYGVSTPTGDSCVAKKDGGI